MKRHPLDTEPSRKDQELRDLLLTDRNEGWTRLWESYERIIRYQIARYEPLRSYTDEVLHEFCIRLFRDDCRILRKWDARRGTLQGYLLMIVRSCCCDFMRSNFFQDSYRFKKSNPPEGESEPKDPLLVLESGNPSPADLVQRREALDRVRRSLDEWAASGRLKPRDRLLLEMRLCGRSFGEISSILDMTVEAASKQYGRLREKLAERLRRKGIEY